MIIENQTALINVGCNKRLMKELDLQDYEELKYHIHNFNQATHNSFFLNLGDQWQIRNTLFPHLMMLIKQGYTKFPSLSLERAHFATMLF